MYFGRGRRPIPPDYQDVLFKVLLIGAQLASLEPGVIIPRGATTCCDGNDESANELRFEWAGRQCCYVFSTTHWAFSSSHIDHRHLIVTLPDLGECEYLVGPRGLLSQELTRLADDLGLASKDR